MIRINLLPVKEKQRAQARRQELSLVTLLLVLLLVLFAALRFRQSHQISSLDSRIADLEAQIAELNVKVAEVADLERKKSDLDARLKVIAKLVKKRVGPAGVMKDLSQATPERLWLTELAETGGSATLSGKAIDNPTIADFLRSLSASPYFTSVDLVETVQDTGGDLRFRRFIIRATINYAAHDGATPPPAPEAGAAP